MEYSVHIFNHNSQINKTKVFETWLCRLVEEEATIFFNFEEYRVKKASVFGVLEGDFFKVISSTTDLQMEVLIFSSNFLNPILSQIGAEANTLSDNLRFMTNQQMENPFAQMLEMDFELLLTMLQQPAKIGQRKMISSVLTHCILTFCNTQSDTSADVEIRNDNSSRQILNRFFELLSQHIQQGHRSCDFFAKELHISVRHLFKVCKTETGQTPKEIINEMLTSEVKSLLLTTDRSIQQIADHYHFPDQSAFGQYFKRQTGISPSEFREKYK